MKNYGINLKKIKEGMLYRIAQSQHFMLQYCARSEGMRDYYVHTYKEHFKPQAPRSKFKYAIQALSRLDDYPPTFL